MSVKFQYGTQADYDSLENFDSTCIYFITDTQRVYKGNTLYTSGIKDVRVNGESVKTGEIVDISVPTKTSDLTNDSNFVSDENYVHTDNNFTSEEKDKLSTLVNYDDTAIKKQIAGKQDKLTAGENITIENNVISLADDFITEVEKKADKTYVDGELAKKQNNLTAGAGISINEDNVISTSANFQVEIVGLDEQGLPSVNEPSSQVLYLTHSTQTEVSDVYNEWLWIYNTEIESFVWEKIGSTQADLSGYAQKSELPTKTSELQNDSNFVSDANYVHTDNNFTTPEKQKLGTLENYVDTAVKSCNTATEKATEIYNTVETKLNNGELKGEKGDKGDPGRQGDPGDTGESGLIELKANTLDQWITNLTNHLYYTVDDVRLRAHNTQKIYLDLPQGTFLLVEKQTGVYGGIDLKITIWGSCTFNNVEYKYGIQQYKYNTLGGFIENSFVLDTKSIETAIANLEANKQNNLTAGAGITITDNGVISSDVGLKIVVLKDGEDLPNEGVPQNNTIYFKRNTETDNESTDWYEEYIWVNNGWELIGTTKVDLSKVDLSGYAQKSELPTKTSQLQNDSGYITSDNIPSEIQIGGEEPADSSVVLWFDENDSGYIVQYPDGDNIKYGTEVINNE